MRAELAAALLAAAEADPRIVLLTGDLGYLALEALRDRLGPRFINVGVAEQNMIGVAAGLAAQGYTPWVYSIAPFVTLRPYEQIRNDVCFHRLPVRLVGNGGGYGYGIMGATHHVLQDIGAMRMLPDMTVYVPLYGADVAEAVAEMQIATGPSYLRLNLALAGAPDARFATWRQLRAGRGGVAITTGPVVGPLLDAIDRAHPGGVAVWSVSRFPFGELPQAVVAAVAGSGRLMTVEEHGAAGGLGEAIAHGLIGQLERRVRYLPLTARGYGEGKYGGQRWHWRQDGLDGDSLSAALDAWMTHDDREPDTRAG